MKVRVKERFFDKENDLMLREEGSCFEAEKERAENLIRMGYVEEHEEAAVEAPQVEAVPEEEQPKKTRKRKKAEE